MKETERQPKVTLEDLLQIKRAERPVAEFWPEFEQTLRTKQLAAIVETRPWWRNWTSRKSFVRVFVPLGATALVAMTFGSFRGFRPSIAAGEQLAGVAPSRMVAVDARSVKADDVAGVRGEKSEPIPVTTEVVALSAPDMQVGAVVASSPMPVSDEPSGVGSTNFITRTLAPYSVMEVLSEPTFVQMVGRVLSVSSQNTAVRAPITEPLTQLATPRDNRRARLLAYAVTFDPHAADSSDAVRSRERITHRLSDEAVYDSITRLGLSGNRVSIKF